MKLRNKKTGEINLGDLHFDDFNSLAELNEEWEDAPEEPKEYWFIDYDGGIIPFDRRKETATDRLMKSIGNYFETREKAERAVKKLEAWKRLKDKGFSPKMWKWEYIYDDNISGELIIKAHIDDATDSDGKYTKDLDLLFGGEE